jgi:hypothetical protein
MDTYFYRGLYKVKLLTKSEGYWLVEAQEDFDDQQNGRRIQVKVGEQKIVESTELHKKKVLAPPVPEHSYERGLERKLKRIVKEYEKETRLSQ